MAVDPAEEKLRDVFSQILKIDHLTDDLTIENVDLWDSLAHMELMIAMEKTFNIRIEFEDIAELTSVSSIRRYLGERL